MKFSKIFNLHAACLLIAAVITPVLSNAQNQSISDGLWSNSANWKNGTPRSDETVEISNDLILDTDIEIDRNGSYRLISGSIINPSTEKKHKIKIEDSGVLEISGNVFIQGELKVEDDGKLIVRSCDTLQVQGKLEFKDNASLVLEECAVIIVDGDFKIKNSAMARVDGQVFVKKKVETKNDAVIDGIGSINSERKIDIKDNSTILGSNVGCNSGPCSIDGGSSLPIVLGDFNAQFIGLGIIQVNWQTLSETNNNHFSISYSTDGINFEVLETISGAGDSRERLNYSTTIPNLPSNANVVYLKLRQTDFDGSYEDFSPIVIQNRITETKKNEENLLFPNPGNGDEVFMVLKNINSPDLKVYIFNSAGEQILSRPMDLENGNNSLKVELLKGVSLKKGIYIVRIIGTSTNIEEKYMVY